MVQILVYSNRPAALAAMCRAQAPKVLRRHLTRKDFFFYGVCSKGPMLNCFYEDYKTLGTGAA